VPGPPAHHRGWCRCLGQQAPPWWGVFVSRSCFVQGVRFGGLTQASNSNLKSAQFHLAKSQGAAKAKKPTSPRDTACHVPRATAQQGKASANPLHHAPFFEPAAGRVGWLASRAPGAGSAPACGAGRHPVPPPTLSYGMWHGPPVGQRVISAQIIQLLVPVTLTYIGALQRLSPLSPVHCRLLPLRHLQLNGLTCRTSLCSTAASAANATASSSNKGSWPGRWVPLALDSKRVPLARAAAVRCLFCYIPLALFKCTERISRSCLISFAVGGGNVPVRELPLTSFSTPKSASAPSCAICASCRRSSSAALRRSAAPVLTPCATGPIPLRPAKIRIVLSIVFNFRSLVR
jgi:hypothetical protein